MKIKRDIKSTFCAIYNIILNIAILGLIVSILIMTGYEYAGVYNFPKWLLSISEVSLWLIPLAFGIALITHTKDILKLIKRKINDKRRY